MTLLKKYSWISWIAIAAASGLAYANEPAQVSTPENEFSVTRARVQQLARELNERAAQVDPATVSSDFVTARAEFTRKAGVALSRFEQDLEQIMSRFEPLLSRIHAVEQSTHYDEDQKRSLVEALETQLRSFADQAESEYKDAIARVYSAFGDIPLRMSFKRAHLGLFDRARVRFHFRDYVVEERIRGEVAECIIHGGVCERIGIKAALQESGLMSQIEQMVTQGCQTISCMSLMTAEWNHYMNMVKTQIDQSLSVRRDYRISIRELNADLEFINTVIQLSNTWLNNPSIPFSN